MSLSDYRVNPSPRSYSAQPMEAHEIDAHPDGDRIWATIMAMRNELRPADLPSWIRS